MIVVEANVAIAVLNPQDVFHVQALERCVRARDVAILNLTRAEALIHPTNAGVGEQAAAALDALGFKTYPVDNDTADRARLLRVRYGNRNFPMIDAIVVAFGLLHDRVILTADAKWPTVADAKIELLHNK